MAIRVDGDEVGGSAGVSEPASPSKPVMRGGIAGEQAQALLEGCAGEGEEVGERAVEGEDAAGEDAADLARPLATCTVKPPS